MTRGAKVLAFGAIAFGYLLTMRTRHVGMVLAAALACGLAWLHLRYSRARRTFRGYRVAHRPESLLVARPFTR